jgi:hypothetical protein
MTEAATAASVVATPAEPTYQTPLMAPGQTEEIVLVVRPHRPYLQQLCHVKLLSRPVRHSADTAQQAMPFDESELMEVRLPFGPWWWVVLLALAVGLVMGLGWLFGLFVFVGA